MHSWQNFARQLGAAQLVICEWVCGIIRTPTVSLCISVIPFLRLFDTFKLLCEFRGGGRRVAAGCTVSVCKSAHVRLLLTQRLCYMSARRDGEQNQGEGSFISNTGWGRYDGAFKGERPTQVTK